MAHMLWQPIPFLGLYPVGIFSHELNDVFRLLVAALFMTEVGIFKNKELVKLTVGHSDKGLSSSSSYVRGWSSFLIWRISKLFLEGKKKQGEKNVKKREVWGWVGAEYKYTIAGAYTEYRWKDSQGIVYTHSWGWGMVLGQFWDKNKKKLSLYTLL